MLKADRMEGERERKIELGEERRWERHKGDDEHKGKSKPSNQNFYQNQHQFSSLQLLFYRVG